MRFHVVSLPHSQTTRAFSHCAYTEKVRKFCDMMADHEVFLYSSSENEAACTEHIPCISKTFQAKHGFRSPRDTHKIEWDADLPYWREMNLRAAREIERRKEDKDFLLLISGSQEVISQALPEMQCVEFGIGYAGVFAPYRVYESYAAMHSIEAEKQGGFYSTDTRDFDTVIHNYYDPADFPEPEEKDDYFLYVGRLIDRKGYRIAQDVCERLHKRLIVCGHGDFDGYGEYRGIVGIEERGKLMSRAQAVFVPTQYLEPFGGVHAEALLCGSPVITSDFGVFTETVTPEVGFRCRSLRDYMDAMDQAPTLDTEWIRFYALSKFSYDAIRPQYESYFEKLLTVWDEGWYQQP
jgi:glycosyltransferase involved in cell wall biosynthesis